MSPLRRFSVAALLVLAPVPVVAADAARQADGQPDSALASPLAGEPLERLSATRERPLFSPTRRPPPPPPPVVHAPEPPPPPPPPPDVALLGIVMDGDEARAVIRTSPAAKVMRVGIGDDIGGWTVRQIEEQHLVLSLDDRIETVTMFAGKSANDPRRASQESPSASIQSPSPTPPQNQIRGNDQMPSGPQASGPRKVRKR
jgi:type II secretory pathway component PulC